MSTINQARQPEYQDGFWQEGMGSGKIIRINYAMKTVLVSYYEKGYRVYSFDTILGSFERIHGGTWVITDSDAGEQA